MTCFLVYEDINISCQIIRNNLFDVHCVKFPLIISQPCSHSITTGGSRTVSVPNQLPKKQQMFAVIAERRCYLCVLIGCQTWIKQEAPGGALSEDTLMCWWRFSVIQVMVLLRAWIRATGLLLRSWRRFISHLKGFFSSKLDGGAYQLMSSDCNHPLCSSDII